MNKKFRLFASASLVLSLVFFGCDRDNDHHNNSSEGYAGPIITAGNLAGPGTELSYAVSECYGNATFDNGSAGAGQVWSFPEYNWFWMWWSNCVAPEQTPYAEAFPEADRAWIDDGDDYYSYELINPDGCYYLGEAGPYDMDILDEPELMFCLPLQTGTQWEQGDCYVYYYTEDDSAYEALSYSYEVDGWGSLETPYDTCLSVRIKNHGEYLYHEAGGETTMIEEYYSYLWLNETGDIVVQTISYIDDDENFTTGLIIMQRPPDLPANSQLPECPWQPGWRQADRFDRQAIDSTQR
jgi:hypothetical protein